MIDLNNTRDRVILGRHAHGDGLIIVGGPPRAGTTLVQNILDMHPKITAGPEFQHLPDIVKMHRAMSRNLARGWLDDYCTQAELDDHLRLLVESLFDKIASQGSRYISEKTPQNVLYFREIANLFPGAKYINVVRDPRAIVASMLAVYRRAVENGVTVYPDYIRDSLKAISYAKRCLRRGHEFAEARTADVYTLRYESLVSEPEAETRKLCEYLNLEWAEEMLRPSSKKHMGEAAITNGIWYDKQMYYRDPDKANIEKWRGTLSPVDALLTTRAFVDFEALGYDFDPSGYSPRDRAVAIARERWARAKTLLLRRTRSVVTDRH